MSRYLTPSKICLLVLIQVYIYEAVPDVAIVPVLAFLHAHILDINAVTPDHPNSWQSLESAVRLVLTIHDFESALQPYPPAAGIPGRRLWHVFLRALWALDSLDALFDFFAHHCPFFVARTRNELLYSNQFHHDDDDNDDDDIDIRLFLSPASVLGTFVDRACLEFERLQFADASDLWLDFLHYRHPTAADLRRHAPPNAPLPPLDPPPSPPAATDRLTVDDIEKFLEFQVDRMQKYGTRVPPNLRAQFHRLLSNSRVVPSLSHYAAFLDAWKAGNYPAAFESLHRYFDYTMRHHPKTLFYHYALINLAAVNADFGCYREAVAAMLESVSSARESRDMTCLNFSLTWLFHFAQAHPHLLAELDAMTAKNNNNNNPHLVNHSATATTTNNLLATRYETLRFLRLNAKDAGTWSLAALALLSEAKLALTRGDDLATAVDHLVRSSALLAAHNVKTIFGPHVALQLAIWDRLGIAALTRITADTFLRLHTSTVFFDDQLKTTFRLARLHAARAQYNAALALLDRLDAIALRSWKFDQSWLTYRRILHLTRALRRPPYHSHSHNPASATVPAHDPLVLLHQLLQSRHDNCEPEIAHIIDALHVDAHVRNGDLDAALALVDDLLLFSSCSRSHSRSSPSPSPSSASAIPPSSPATNQYPPDLSIHLTLLLTKARLLALAGRPERALALALRTARRARRARLLPLLWLAVAALARVCLACAHPDAAVTLLIAVIPRAIETGDCALVADLYTLLADAYVGLAGAETARRKDYLTKANSALNTAGAHYDALADPQRQCDVMARQAVVMRAAGNTKLALDYAARYHNLRQPPCVTILPHH